MVMLYMIICHHRINLWFILLIRNWFLAIVVIMSDAQFSFLFTLDVTFAWYIRG